MNLDTARVNNDSKSRGVRCDCNGGKTRRMDKIITIHGVTTVLGPHRRGQVGCQFNKHYGPEEPPADYYC